MIRLAIHSVPRSGSSWLGQIINSSTLVNYSFQPLFSYAFKGALNLKSSQLEITQFFEQIAKSNDAFINQTEAIKNGFYPSFTKAHKFTHIAYKEVRYHNLLPHLMHTDEALKTIGLIRNPIAVLNSWFSAPREFRADLGWKEKDEWLNAKKKNLNKPEEYYGYKKWKEATLMFENLERLYPKRFMIIRYDSLVKNPVNTTKKAFSFCELEWNSQSSDFLELSITREVNDPYSVFKLKNSEDDSSKFKLPKEIREFIMNDLANTPLEKYLLG